MVVRITPAAGFDRHLRVADATEGIGVNVRLERDHAIWDDSPRRWLHEMLCAAIRTLAKQNPR